MKALGVGAMVDGAPGTAATGHISDAGARLGGPRWLSWGLVGGNARPFAQLGLELLETQSRLIRRCGVSGDRGPASSARRSARRLGRIFLYESTGPSARMYSPGDPRSGVDRGRLQSDQWSESSLNGSRLSSFSV